MKRNLLLLFVLIALIGVTYLVQEKREEKRFHESLTLGRVISDPITEIKFKDFHLVKKDNQWWSGKELLSHNEMNQLERKLKQIKEIKDVDGEWKTYFSRPLRFEVNGRTYTLGDLTLDRQAFYLGVEDKVKLAMIEGESAELTTDENEIAATKYRELRSLLEKDLKDLKETQLFRYYPKLPLKRVAVDAEGNLAFELDLENNTTIPPPIPGIEVHDDLKSKFFSLITQITLREEIPYSEKLKFKKMGMMKFMDGDREVIWELWLRNKSTADAVIIDPEQKRAFLMVGGTLRPFFVQLQDYWDKKVIPPSAFHSFQRLKLTLTQGEKRAQVQIINTEPLKFESETHQVKSENMHALFHYIFNLRQYDQADRVSLLSKSERQQVLSQNFLRLEIMGQDLILWPKAQELIIVNLTQGFKAHFGLEDKSLGFKFEDVLK